jgi:zinc transport system substrate-binding protein
MRLKKILCFVVSLFIALTSTGCFKSDSMEDINIYTTVYPIEYIVNRLYGEYGKVTSIYPDGVIPTEYKLTNKQIKDYSSADLFVFNGLIDEKKYVTDFFKYNKNIMIIDSTASMEIANRTEELWLNPSNLLMIAQNIKNGFDEYVTNHYIKNNIETNYDALKLELSNLDASISLVVENASRKDIIVTDDLFLFLSKYGFNVISLDSDTTNEKTISQAKALINSKAATTIFAPNNEELNDVVKSIVEDTGVKISHLHTLSNITEQERNNKKDYITIMKENIEALKAEVYK